MPDFFLPLTINWVDCTIQTTELHELRFIPLFHELVTSDTAGVCDVQISILSGSGVVITLIEFNLIAEGFEVLLDVGVIRSR
ncbi:hypothetical protein D3C80_1918860 [compost metagenome]